MNGRIRLVLGNHDKKRIKNKHYDLFDWVKPYYESKTEDGIKVVMCHYPFERWNLSHHGSWHLHGHSHGTCRSGDLKRLDVGVDIHNFTPLRYSEVKNIMRDKPQFTEHH